MYDPDFRDSYRSAVMLIPLLFLQLESVSPILRGDAALQRHELAIATSAFAEAASDADPARRVVGERMLALIDRRFRRDYTGARAHLSRALATQADSAASLDEAALLALDEGRFADAYALAERALAAAPPSTARRFTLTLADAWLEPRLRRAIDGDTVARDDWPGDRGGALLGRLRTLVRQAPGRPDEASRLLLVALLVGDRAAAAEAVRAYYRPGFDAPPDRRFAAALAAVDSLLRRGDRPLANDRRLAAALGRIRLFDAAALVAPPSSEILAYDRFCRRVARESADYYRLVLLGEARFDRLVRVYNRAAAELWPRLAWRGAPPRFYPAALAPELARRFGTVVHFGVTSGFYDLHMGHIVRDDRRVITQYGKRARVRFVSLDGMVSNGLQSWAWEAQGAHGGWERGDTIVEVRPAFLEHAMTVRERARVTEAAERQRIVADSLIDEVLVATDSLGYFPGVDARIRRDARDQILDSLRASGVPADSLDVALLGATMTLLRESSIFAHEGRHAIDRLLEPRATPEEREFRAKLSEIALARRPRLALSAIIHPNIGDATPHGRANRRIMVGLARWIRAHGAEIDGYDAARPALLQLPRLTDVQLRRAFRAMDPLAAN